MFALAEALVWVSENLWALILHVTGRGCFPKPLRPEEERALVTQMHAGDGAARDELIAHNLRLAAHIAKKYQSSAAEADDLVSVGSIGLIKAVDTFRPEAGRLTTYASRCIENEILMYLRAGRKNRSQVLLDEPIGADKEGNEIRLTDILGTDRDVVSDAAERSIEMQRALRLLHTDLLTSRERRVLEMRYGLCCGVAYPQHEVARVLGISRSYVSRIEKKALEKLRAALEGVSNP